MRSNMRIQREDTAAHANRRGEGESRPALASPRQGQALEPRSRAWLEAGFGHDFANVRIHADREADQLARAAEATAFTVGQDIYFREEAYAPDSDAGRKLLAHEMTHVVQRADQEASPASALVSRPADPAETEATHAADRITSGGTAVVQASPGAAISRDGGSSEHTLDYWLNKISPDASTNPLGTAGGALAGMFTGMGAAGALGMATNAATLAATGFAAVPGAMLATGMGSYTLASMALNALDPLQLIGLGERHSGSEDVDEDAVSRFMDEQGMPSPYEGPSPGAPVSYLNPEAFLPPGQAVAEPEAEQIPLLEELVP
jgi:hypothetical protein